MLAYKVTNVANGKAYIGITAGTLRRRWLAHLSDAAAERRGSLLHRAIRKYGVGAFRIEVLATAVDLRELKVLERALIAAHGTFVTAGRGYNLTAGGEGMLGYKASQEARAKMSLSRRGKKRSAAMKEKMRAIMTGKVWGENTRRRCSAAQRARFAASPETGKTRAKKSAAHKGRPKSAEWRARMSVIALSRTPEVRAKIAAARRSAIQAKIAARAA
jgi:group I intron endonuclease